MLIPVGTAFKASCTHFGNIVGLEAQGGAVIFPGAVFEAFSPGDKVTHDALLVVHAEEGTAGCDGGAVAADHGGEMFIAACGFGAVGLGRIVGQTNAEVNLGMGQVNRGQIQRFTSDFAIADGDRRGVIALVTVGGIETGGIEAGGIEIEGCRGEGTGLKGTLGRFCGGTQQETGKAKAGKAKNRSDRQQFWQWVGRGIRVAVFHERANCPI